MGQRRRGTQRTVCLLASLLTCSLEADILTCRPIISPQVQEDCGPPGTDGSSRGDVAPRPPELEGGVASLSGREKETALKYVPELHF